MTPRMPLPPVPLVTLRRLRIKTGYLIFCRFKVTDFQMAVSRKILLKPPTKYIYLDSTWTCHSKYIYFIGGLHNIFRDTAVWKSVTLKSQKMRYNHVHNILRLLRYFRHISQAQRYEKTPLLCGTRPEPWKVHISHTGWVSGCIRTQRGCACGNLSSESPKSNTQG